MPKDPNAAWMIENEFNSVKVSFVDSTSSVIVLELGKACQAILCGELYRTTQNKRKHRKQHAYKQSVSQSEQHFQHIVLAHGPPNIFDCLLNNGRFKV